MKNRAIHQNLDTSFVNLSALLKYLRRRQFVGSVKLQLNGYKADIELHKDNQMKVSEHDQISGRISSGEEALQRVLIRAREAGGSINVFQIVESEVLAENTKREIPPVEDKTKEEPILDAEIIEPIPKPVQNKIRQNGNSNGSGLPINKPQEKPKKKETTLPDFPFSLTNDVEAKAKRKELSVEEWQTLLKLTVEILTVVDKSLATANLDFSAAFRKARTEVADDYPYLNPAADIFDYSKGKIKMTEKVDEKIFVTSIMETLRRILDKLETNSKFEDVHHRTSQTLVALLNKRKPHYDKFSITQHLGRILGI